MAAAFPDKLAAMLGDRGGLAAALEGRAPDQPCGPALFADLLHVGEPPTAWVATLDGAIRGVVEVRDPSRARRRRPWGAIRKHLGLRRSVRAWLFDRVFHSVRPAGDELYVEALAVDAAARGRGLGSLLVRFVLTEAERRGKRAVTLYCIDRNEGARRLYRRLGFRTVRRERLGPLRFLVGFAATDYMRADVSSFEHASTVTIARAGTASGRPPCDCESITVDDLVKGSR